MKSVGTLVRISTEFITKIWTPDGLIYTREREVNHVAEQRCLCFRLFEVHKCCLDVVAIHTVNKPSNPHGGHSDTSGLS